MKAWRRSSRIGIAPSSSPSTATVTSVSTDGSNVATVVFSTNVVSITDVSKITADGNPGASVVGGLGTQLIDIDFGSAIDPGRPWTYTEPAAGVIYSGGETGISSAGTTA